VTLAVSAVGVNLPRLSLELRGLADQVGWVLSRDARADLRRLFLAFARIHALAATLQGAGAMARADLIGWHRTQYDDVGSLELAGVAAWPWRTESGYAGLTVLFWDRVGLMWNSWTDTRPRHIQPDFDPAARYDEAGPWEGAQSPRQAARARLYLVAARRNWAGRLSASSKTRAFVVGPTHPADIGAPVFSNWAALQEHLAKVADVGLAEPNPLRSIVVLQPVKWSKRQYDEVSQTLHWPMLDNQGQALRMAVPHDEFNATLIEALESLRSTTLTGARWVGRIAPSPEGPQFFPYSMIAADGVISNLALDFRKAKSKSKSPSRTRGPAAAPLVEEATSADVPGQTETQVSLGTAPARLLNRLEDRLLLAAEAGGSALNIPQREEFAAFSREAQTLGLEVLAESLRALATPSAGEANRQTIPLLHCRYFVWLHEQALRGQ
jgi:hypothetical protein